MNFEKTFAIYNEYKDFKFQECCYDGIESVFREDDEILENEHLLSRIPLMEFVDMDLQQKTGQKDKSLCC